MAPLTILVLGNTKRSELLYLRSHILYHHTQVDIILIDVGRSYVSPSAISVPQDEVVNEYGEKAEGSLDLSSIA